MVAEHHLAPARGQQHLAPVEHGGHVRAPVHHIAEQHQPPAPGVLAVGAIAEVVEEGDQGVPFAVDVADQVQGPGRQGSDESVHK